MAGNGLLGRIGNLWRGFWSLWVSDVERRNPEVAYENALRSMVEKYAGLKRATAALVRRRGELEARFRAGSRELEGVERGLDAAVDAGDDEVGLLLVQKRQQLARELAEVRGELDGAMKEAESAKTALLQVQREIRALKSEKDAMLARLRSAEARLRIQEQLDGLSVDADVKALENVREHIGNVVAEASLGRELEASSLDARLAAVEARSAETAARRELDALKAARAQRLPAKKAP
jgi:phage shock protein A